MSRNGPKAGEMGKLSMGMYSRLVKICQWLQFSPLLAGCAQNQERPPLPDVRLQVLAKPGIGAIGKQTDFWKTGRIVAKPGIQNDHKTDRLPGQTNKNNNWSRRHLKTL